MRALDDAPNIRNSDPTKIRLTNRRWGKRQDKQWTGAETECGSDSGNRDGVRPPFVVARAAVPNVPAAGVGRLLANPPNVLAESSSDRVEFRYLGAMGCSEADLDLAELRVAEAEQVVAEQERRAANYT